MISEEAPRGSLGVEGSCLFLSLTPPAHVTSTVSVTLSPLEPPGGASRPAVLLTTALRDRYCRTSSLTCSIIASRWFTLCSHFVYFTQSWVIDCTSSTRPLPGPALQIGSAHCTTCLMNCQGMTYSDVLVLQRPRLGRSQHFVYFSCPFHQAQRGLYAMSAVP